MSPNCAACDKRQHYRCTDEHCECAVKGHPDPTLAVDQETSVPVPNYVLLKLWMALGHEPNHEFDDAIAVRGKADVWSYLLSQVRALNAAGATNVAGAERADPLYLRAKAGIEEMLEITEVETDVDMDDVITDSRGRIVHGTLRSIVRVTGRLS